jgi:hypothetical protein
LAQDYVPRGARKRPRRHFPARAGAFSALVGAYYAPARNVNHHPIAQQPSGASNGSPTRSPTARQSRRRPPSTLPRSASDVANPSVRRSGTPPAATVAIACATAGSIGASAAATRARARPRGAAGRRRTRPGGRAGGPARRRCATSGAGRAGAATGGGTALGLLSAAGAASGSPYTGSARGARTARSRCARATALGGYLAACASSGRRAHAGWARRTPDHGSRGRSGAGDESRRSFPGEETAGSRRGGPPRRHPQRGRRRDAREAGHAHRDRSQICGRGDLARSSALRASRSRRRKRHPECRERHDHAQQDAPLRHLAGTRNSKRTPTRADDALTDCRTCLHAWHRPYTVARGQSYREDRPAKPLASM